MRMREPHAGELNRRVTIRRRVDLPAADMGLSPSYEGAVMRWAKIEPVGAATYAGSVQIDETITHRITLRHMPGITTAHEVVHGSAVYRVRRITNMNGGYRWTAIEAEQLGEG